MGAEKFHHFIISGGHRHQEGRHGGVIELVDSYRGSGGLEEIFHRGDIIRLHRDVQWGLALTILKRNVRIMTEQFGHKVTPVGQHGQVEGGQELGVRLVDDRRRVREGRKGLENSEKGFLLLMNYGRVESTKN